MFFIRRPVGPVALVESRQKIIFVLLDVVTLSSGFLHRVVETGHQLDWTD